MIDDIKRDRDRPQVKKLSDADWDVVIDGPSPGWVEVRGPALKVSGPTTATNLNGEDFVARHADARRIARVPDMEDALIEAVEALRIAHAEIVALERDMETLLRGDFVKGRTHEETGDPLLVVEAAIARATGEKP